MNKYLLTCLYCDHSWGINYNPVSKVYCPQCKDGNITATDLSKDSIDYYAGSPPFKDKEFDKEWNF